MMREPSLNELWAERIEEEGAQAFLAGEADFANPYLFGTLNYTLWERGYDRARVAQP